jgi:hypothetical protein
MADRSRFDALMNTVKRVPGITFEEGEPVLVIPLSEPTPYVQQERGVTRYRIRVARLLEDGTLVQCQMTLPKTATEYFQDAAAHGGLVAVTMENTTDGLRYWSKRIDAILTDDEQKFVDNNRVPDQS